MPCIIVTTPKSEIENSRREAEECKKAGGGRYFRRIGDCLPRAVKAGDRIYYVEDGYIRGFCIIEELKFYRERVQCETTGNYWQPGAYAFMDATTWHWIEPIPQKGFRGYLNRGDFPVKIVGGWLDPRPDVGSPGPLFEEAPNGTP
jgi:hypothetical protein